MHSGLVHVGDWVEITLWDDKDYWQVAGMTHYGDFKVPYHSVKKIASKRKIAYSLPVRCVLQGGVEILAPDCDAFRVQNKPINSFIEKYGELYIGLLYLNYNDVIKLESSQPCLNCGWFCFQQCFQWRESYRPKDILP